MSLHVQRPFTGPGEVLAGDIEPGDIVKFRHERAPDANISAVVLDIDEPGGRIDYLQISPGYERGTLQFGSLADRGLRPYSNGWNPDNHTQSTGARVSPTLLRPESARRIKGVLDSITEMQERHGITPTPPTLEDRALDALVIQAIEDKKIYDWGTRKATVYDI